MTLPYPCGIDGYAGYKVEVVAVGSIHVLSSPSGATVHLDGTGNSSLGTTPITITGVPIGTHTITLKLATYQDYTATGVSVTDGGTAEVSHTMVLVATPADIRAYSMLISPNDPCTQGSCVVTVTVTWRNYGETTGSYTPSITVAGVPPGTIDETYTSQNLAGGTTSGSKVFTIRGLTAGTHSICPILNT